MNRGYVLRTIATLMDWDDETATKEFAWLKLMSRLKYDDYQEFLAGVRFVESLANWLQQFPKGNRLDAYAFVRSRLLFFSVPEMRHLVELLYPETIEPLLLNRTSTLKSIPKYRVWSTPDAKALYKKLLRQTVFIELSDGARIDIFRRVNEGLVSNEQVITAPRINSDKWDEMLKDLRSAVDDADARFTTVVLVDDFTASGKTLFREEDGQWKGKLQKFWDDLLKVNILETHFEVDWTLVVHHYLATSQAKKAIEESHKAKLAGLGEEKWFRDVSFTYGSVLPPEVKISPADVPAFAALVEKFYDPSIESRHTKVGGDDVRWGFGGCALPLIIEHNAPNNSIALLWAESNGEDGQHQMRPLFRRRQRHI